MDYGSMDSKRKQRSSNFSREEELILLEHIATYKDIIECKSNNKMSNFEKDNAWKKIFQLFSAATATHRSVDQIKVKYDNLKSRAKKELARKKNHIRRYTDEIDEVSQAVFNIINKKPGVRLGNPSDTDGNKTNSVDPLDEAENSSPPKDSNEEWSGAASHCGDSTTSKETESSEFAFDEAKTDVDISYIIEKEDTEIVIPTKHNYMPQELKKPTNTKLNSNNQFRPLILTPVGEAKASYYKKKLELLEKAAMEELAIKKRREEREEEEHTRKIILLDLEIQLKKRELESARM